MKEYLSMGLNKRQEIIEKIKKALLKKEEVVFAFIFGSFADSPSFRDIDVGIYIQNIDKQKVFNYETQISKEIADICGLPFDIIDVKVLNFAPNSFLSNIFKNGRPLFSKNDHLLSDLIESASLDAIANEHIARQSLKELVPA